LVSENKVPKPQQTDLKIKCILDVFKNESEFVLYFICISMADCQKFCLIFNIEQIKGVSLNESAG
jgi:hypothetical protein